MTEKSELTKLREKAGLSIHECSEETETPYTTWWNWEKWPHGKYYRKPRVIAFVWLNLRIENERLRAENERLRMENECLKSGRVFRKFDQK